MFLDADQKGEKRKGGTSAARRVSSKARSGQMPGSASGRSDDGNWTLQVPQMERVVPGEHGGNQSMGLADTSSRTHRSPERSTRRASATACPIQTSTRTVSLPNMAGGGRRGLIPTVCSSQGAGKSIQRGGERHHMGQPFNVEVEWLNQFRKRLISASDVGRFPEMWNTREIHPKGDQCELW